MENTKSERVAALILRAALPLPLHVSFLAHFIKKKDKVETDIQPKKTVSI